jgi:hypothetical protein
MVQWKEKDDQVQETATEVQDHGMVQSEDKKFTFQFPAKFPSNFTKKVE